MKRQKQILRCGILISLACILSFSLIEINPSIKRTNQIRPKSSDTHLIWELDLTASPEDLAISDDGKYIAISDNREDNAILINGTNSAIIWKYSSPSSIYCMDMSADGNYIIIGCSNHRVYLFDNTQSSFKTPLWSYDTGEVVSDVAISADGVYAVAGTAGPNHYVILFNVTKILDPFIWSDMTPANSVGEVAISANGSKIAVSAFTTIFCYNLTSSTPYWSDATPGTKDCLVISANGKYIATGGDPGDVYFYESSSDSHLWYDDLPGVILSIDITDDGEYLVVGGGNSICALYNKAGSNPERNFHVDAYDDVYSVSISKDGNYVAAGYEYIKGSNRNTVYFYNRTSSDPSWKYLSKSSIRAVALSFDGTYLVATEESSEPSMFLFETVINLPDPYSLSPFCSKVGRTFVYEIIEWNETLGSIIGLDLTDIESSASVGKQRCYEITQITKESKYWTIYYKVWNWGMDFHSNTPYSSHIQVYIYPLEVGSDVLYIHPDFMSIIPLPVNNYLEGIDWDLGCSSSSNSYSYEIFIDSTPFTLIVNYASEGYLKNFLWTINGNLLLNVSYVGERTDVSIPTGLYYLIFIGSSIMLITIIVRRKLRSEC